MKLSEEKKKMTDILCKCFSVFDACFRKWCKNGNETKNKNPTKVEKGQRQWKKREDRKKDNERKTNDPVRFPEYRVISGKI